MIYFIHNERSKAIKIGRSSDPVRRLANLRTASADPLELIATFPGDAAEEAALHRRFEDHRRDGEWFNDCEAIHITIRAMQVGPDPLARFFGETRVIEPELCYLISTSVGFAAAIWWGSGHLLGTDHDCYQVMRWDEGPGPGHAFWNWYLEEMPQWFDTPLQAAFEFTRWWREWVRQGRPLR